MTSTTTTSNFKVIFAALIIGLSLLMLGGPVSANPASRTAGRLSLVSIGAGDLDNMTIRAHRTIAEADIVFAMRGSAERCADLLKGKQVHDAGHGLFGMGGTTRGAGTQQRSGTSNAPDNPTERQRATSAGGRQQKSPAEIAAQQEETRSIIRGAIAAGRNVVILDNGDPTVFGPHIGYVREFADLNPHIVPGLSSFNAANAALQTSVVGGSGRAVTLTMARLDDGRDEILARMVREGNTLALFMVRDLEGFVTSLNARLPGDTPVAIVANAGFKEQERVIAATLDTILTRVGTEKLPVFLFYVGDFLAGRTP